METLKNIIRNNQMSTRPEYYSGRGATTSDLNEKILFGIHRDIREEFGEEAGKGFVNMVEGIKVLSATAFLNGLYDLFYSNWEYSKRQPDSISIPKDRDGNYDPTIGIVSIMESLFSSGRDDTQQIKFHFLQSNGIECRELFSEDGYSAYYY